MGAIQDLTAGYASGTIHGRLAGRSAVSLSLLGGRELIRNFELLPVRVQRRVARGAVMKIARLMVKEVKAGIKRENPPPIDSGLLLKSLGYRMWTSKTARWAVGATIGPRTGFGRLAIRLDKEGKKKLRRAQIAHVRAGGGSKPVYADPVKYAHLVEGGRKESSKTGGVAPRPFMRHSYLRSRDIMAGTLRTEIRNGIEREARKLARI